MGEAEATVIQILEKQPLHRLRVLKERGGRVLDRVDQTRVGPEQKIKNGTGR